MGWKHGTNSFLAYTRKAAAMFVSLWLLGVSATFANKLTTGYLMPAQRLSVCDKISKIMILHRRSASGFVQYPKEFGNRLIDGTARFRTKCDMLVGPCSCGAVHQENDAFVQQMLEAYNASIEQINLIVSDDGKVYIPRYWAKSFRHELCNVLSGICNCGVTHTANENWVIKLLELHSAKILGCLETDLPSRRSRIGKQILDEPIEPYHGDCQCADCLREWESIQIRQRVQSFRNPSRTEI